MKSLEKDLLKAAKAASKQHKGSDITTFISGKDQDELALRDKLVSKLKEKEIEKMKQYGENLKDSSFIFSDDGSMEEISDEDLVIKSQNFRKLESNFNILPRNVVNWTTISKP